MSYTMNAELAAALTALMPQLEQAPSYQQGDALSWRARSQALYALFNEQLPDVTDVTMQSLTLPFGDITLAARWYQHDKTPSQGAVVFIHGGGGISSSIASYDKLVSGYVAQSGVNFLSLEYQLSPEVTGDIQAEQAVAALLWLREHSAVFAIDPARIILMGDSGGGAIVASAAIVARDRGIALAGQILIYPMLDHRPSKVDPAVESLVSISAGEISTCWGARLASPIHEDRLPYAVPALIKEYTGLAPCYIDVGDLDLFASENLAWAKQLMAAGVPVEFHLYSGVNHGFELLAPHSAIARQAMQFRIAAIQRLTA